MALAKVFIIDCKGCYVLLFARCPENLYLSSSLSEQTMEELISDLRETTGNYSGDTASLGIRPRVVGTSLSPDPTIHTIAPEVKAISSFVTYM